MNELFKEAEQLFWSRFSNGSTMALATAWQDRVTSRTVNVAAKDQKIYFLTEEGTTKWEQITKNPNIGLSCDYVQITGKAEFIGHPADEKNKEITDIMRSCMQDFFDQYAASKTARLAEITLETLMIYRDEAMAYQVDFTEQTAQSISLE